MIETIVVVTFVLLSVVSALHFYWGFGGLWPAKDVPSLARTVVGSNGTTEMPSAGLTVVVAFCIFLAGLLPLFWVGWITLPIPHWFITIGMVTLTVVFLLRGILGFAPVMTKMSAEEPFATLNRRYFSPLITLVGLGLLYLLISLWG